MDLLRRVVKLLPALIAPAIAVAAVWLWHPTPGQDVLLNYPAAQGERQPKSQAEAVKEIPARVLARGSLDFPFLAYDTFGPGRIALAAPTREGTVEVMVAQFQRGELEPVSSVQEPMGAVLDVTHGDLLNNGALQAIAVTARGLLVLEGTETADPGHRPPGPPILPGVFRYRRRGHALPGANYPAGQRGVCGAAGFVHLAD